MLGMLRPLGILAAVGRHTFGSVQGPQRSVILPQGTGLMQREHAAAMLPTLAPAAGLPHQRLGPVLQGYGLLNAASVAWHGVCSGLVPP